MFSKEKFSKVKFIGLVVFGSLASAQVFAAPASQLVSLSQVTDYYVDSASSTTSGELQNQVYSDILNTAHKLDVETLEVETRVLISSTESEKDQTPASE